jgi:hypothetical protein
MNHPHFTAPTRWTPGVTTKIFRVQKGSNLRDTLGICGPGPLLLTVLPFCPYPPNHDIIATTIKKSRDVDFMIGPMTSSLASSL